MTDGRIAGKWLVEPRFCEMPDPYFAFFVRALTWCNEAGTDGAISTRYLAALHADGERKPEIYDYLETVGLWEKTETGYRFLDWSVSVYKGGLGQSTAEQVRDGKAKAAKRQKDYRERTAAQTEKMRADADAAWADADAAWADAEQLPGNNVTASRNGVTNGGHVGHDTTGHDTTRHANEGNQQITAENEEKTNAAYVWTEPVTQPGRGLIDENPF